MAKPSDWATAFARQADADFRAWERFEQYPEAVAAECHRLQVLQMACEKLCKAYLIRRGAVPDSIVTSHSRIAGPLPVILREQIIHMKSRLKGMHGTLKLIRHLAREIELLNPAAERDGQRPDNCDTPGQPGTRSSLPSTGVSPPPDWPPPRRGGRS